MQTNATPVIRLEDITKVFFTDDVETHALNGIQLDIRPGEYRVHRRAVGLRQVDAAGHHGPAGPPTAGGYWLSGQPVASLGANERADIRNREIGSSSRPSTSSAT